MGNNFFDDGVGGNNSRGLHFNNWRVDGDKAAAWCMLLANVFDLCVVRRNSLGANFFNDGVGASNFRRLLFCVRG